MSYEVFSSSNQDISKVWQQLSLFISRTKFSLSLWSGVSKLCILFIGSVNILVVWITLPHSEHGFFKYFKTKLVYHKYHIPKVSSKWTNSILFICPVNILVVWIAFTFCTWFFKYFYTKLVDQKYHIPKFSSKWTNSMTFEVFSSSN